MTEYLEIKEMLSSLINMFDCQPISNELYGDFLLRWFATYKQPKNKDKSNTEMLKTINKYIVPGIGQIPIGKLSGDMIQLFFNALPVSNIRDKIALIINGSLKKAVKLRLIYHNPFDLVEIRHNKKRHYIPLSFAEQDTVYASCKNKLYRAVFCVMICTGLRVGEFLALDFTESYILECNVLRIRKSVDISTGKLQDTPKTDSSVRDVPLLPWVLPFVKTLQSAYKKNYRFTYNSIKCYFRKIYRNNNIHCNIHSFRHTFTSLCYYADIKLKAIQQLLGHSTMDVTVNTYTHLLENGESVFLPYFRDLKLYLESRPTNIFRRQIYD